MDPRGSRPFKIPYMQKIGPKSCSTGALIAERAAAQHAFQTVPHRNGMRQGKVRVGPVRQPLQWWQLQPSGGGCGGGGAHTDTAPSHCGKRLRERFPPDRSASAAATTAAARRRQLPHCRRAAAATAAGLRLPP